MDIRKDKILQKLNKLRLVAFMDSYFAKNEDRKNITGGMVTMGGSPSYFTSKMQAIVSLSWIKAEYITLGTVTQEVQFQAQTLDKLFGKKHKK